MTYVGSTSRSTNRVLIALVVITVLIVAWWAIDGGLDQIPVIEETAVVSD